MTKASARQYSAMISVYHYTDEVGFKALSSGAAWIPSTGLTIDPNTPFDIHLTCSVAAASLSFYVQQWNQCDFRQKSSTQFRDINYGPGWYLTNLPPSTSTNQLLDALWLGNREFADRTTYWLRVLSQDVVTPDDERPSVKFLPVYQSRRADTNNPFGGRTSPVLLVDAGMRREERAERVDVKVLTDIPHIPSKFVEIVPLSHRQGNCIPYAAIRWHDFGNRPALGRPLGHFSRHPDTPLLSLSPRRRFPRPTPERVFVADHQSSSGFSGTGPSAPPPQPIGT